MFLSMAASLNTAWSVEEITADIRRQLSALLPASRIRTFSSQTLIAIRRQSLAVQGGPRCEQ